MDYETPIVKNSPLPSPNALGIGAASLWSAAEKDRAESPTRSGTPKKKRQQTFLS